MLNTNKILVQPPAFPFALAFGLVWAFSFGSLGCFGGIIAKTNDTRKMLYTWALCRWIQNHICPSAKHFQL